MCRKLHEINFEILNVDFSDCGNCQKRNCFKCYEWNKERIKVLENVDIQKEIEQEEITLKECNKIENQNKIKELNESLKSLVNKVEKLELLLNKLLIVNNLSDRI